MAWTNASQSRSLDFETEGGPRRVNKSRVHGASTARPRRVPVPRVPKGVPQPVPGGLVVRGPRFFVNCVLYVNGVKTIEYLETVRPFISFLSNQLCSQQLLKGCN